MRLKRLYKAIEAGSLDPAESALGERIAGITAIRDQARADAARTEAMLKSSAHQGLTGATVRELASEARAGLRFGKGGYRREHVRAFAQHVEVADDAIYINGNKNTLLRTLIATTGGKSVFPVLYQNGGRGGIRTHGTVSRTPVFKTGSLNHSDTLPFD